MAREETGPGGGRHWFFLDGMRGEPGTRVDLTPISHQLRRVLRLDAGAVITLLDGSGAAFPTRIESLASGEAAGTVLRSAAALGEPSVELTLYQCVPKGDRFTWILQKGTEIGVTRFAPVISSRTVVRPAERLLAKYERWRAIVREAAEQSRRGRIPVIEEPLHWAEALERVRGLGLFAWEEADGNRANWQTRAADSTAVSLLVGPEGGIAKEEAAAAQAMGWLPVSLGPRVLRSETAAIAAAALVMHLAGELG